ncbi:hypothetical protein C8A03DRAFT_35589 [Achaetomium macrosporum]|uniref:Uncharacterized protein n=1 Tax=Achaetomium macrosporum TaxID=79813 RepID=A0AAN7C6V0_9PEZI|nr:hypothetical protein C8A03DRAFT_35589 [Achaetomium macrosporum]
MALDTVREVSGDTESAGQIRREESNKGGRVHRDRDGTRPSSFVIAHNSQEGNIKYPTLQAWRQQQQQHPGAFAEGIQNDQTYQAWLQYHQQQQQQQPQPGGFGQSSQNHQPAQAWQKPTREQRSSERWKQRKSQIESIGAAAWEAGQERMEEELRATLYRLHHEAVQMRKARDQMGQEYQQRHEQQLREQQLREQQLREQQQRERLEQVPQQPHQPQHRHLKPLRSALRPQQPPTPPDSSPEPAPQPQPTFIPPQTPANRPPSQMTHPEKLSVLLGQSEALYKALFETRDLVTDHEQRLARSECRTARLDELTSFFRPIERIVERAKKCIKEYHRAAQRTEQGAGHFRVVLNVERDFCAAWEGVVQLYEQVDQWEGLFSDWLLAAVGEQRVDDYDVDENGKAVWEGYVAAVVAFGKAVRVFEEGFLMGHAEQDAGWSTRW